MERLVRNSKEKGQTTPAANSLSESTTAATPLISGLRRNSNGGGNVHGTTSRTKGVSTSQDDQLHGSTFRDMAPQAAVIKKHSELPENILRTTASKQPTVVSFSSTDTNSTKFPIIISQYPHRLCLRKRPEALKQRIRCKEEHLALARATHHQG